MIAEIQSAKRRSSFHVICFKAKIFTSVAIKNIVWGWFFGWFGTVGGWVVFYKILNQKPTPLVSILLPALIHKRNK